MIPRTCARLVLASALLFACKSEHVDAPRAATKAAEPDATVAARLAKEVDWLAADAREGRRAGTEPARESARWIAKELGSIGLEPCGDGSGWFQEFQVGLDPRAGDTSLVTYVEDAPQANDGRTSVQVVTKAMPLFCSEPGAAHGRLVFCGYGIEDAERGWDDFAGKELAGRVALVVRGTPRTAPKRADDAQDAKPGDAVVNPHAAPGNETQLVAAAQDPWGSAGSIFTKVMNAKRHGAVAVVLVPQRAYESVLAFDAGHGARSGLPCVMLDWSAANELATKALALDAWVRDTPAPPSNVSKGEVIVSADVIREHGTALNVLGRLKGRTSERCVVVGAHYDHLGRGGTGSLAPKATGEIHNGADDNASGTATVIEIARRMKTAGTPPCDVVFALWSGEELGLLGSEWWAAHPTIPLARVKANLNLDMVGRAGNGKLQVLGAGTAEEFAGWMKDVGAASGLELTVSVSGQALGGSSDHQTFLKRGIPALHLFSGLHADYHKPSDDADKFEAGGAAKVATLGADLVQRMANAKELHYLEPRAPSSEGEKKVASGGFKVRLGTIPNYAYDGKGVLIDGASQDTPAERAGLIKGDVLLKIGDVELANVYDLTYALGRFKPGDVVVVKYLREGKEQETRVTLAAPAGEVK